MWKVGQLSCYISPAYIVKSPMVYWFNLYHAMQCTSLAMPLWSTLTLLSTEDSSQGWILTLCIWLGYRKVEIWHFLKSQILGNFFRDYWSNTRLVCTHLNAFSKLSSRMIIKIWIPYEFFLGKNLTSCQFEKYFIWMLQTYRKNHCTNIFHAEFKYGKKIQIS